MDVDIETNIYISHLRYYYSFEFLFIEKKKIAILDFNE